MQISEQQKQASLEHIQKWLQKENRWEPERHSNELIFRFLRARKFDLEKTEKMLLDAEVWRVDAGVEEIAKSYSFPEDPEIQTFYPRYYHKTDKTGRPVYVERLGLLDCKRLFEVTTQERLVKRYVREYEKLIQYRFPSCSKKAGHHIEQGTTILDLKGVPLSQFNQVRKVVQSVSSIAQNYYPETLGKMFIINAPTLFTAIWVIIRAMLDENTVAKISVLGSDYSKELLKVIDAENLEVGFGGTCTTPVSDIGPWNDGSTPGYPDTFYEGMSGRDAASK